MRGYIAFGVLRREAWGQTDISAFHYTMLMDGNEDEARGAATKWLLDNHPQYMIGNMTILDLTEWAQGVTIAVAKDRLSEHSG